ncbi:MAG: hypothetical protein IJU23_06575, partial [Proteobacteria bacterium]|nr:hypothetical protein [Pseudomonadota bacterium]
SGATYSLYQSPDISPATVTWFNDALLLDEATITGGTASSVTAGTATGGGPGGSGNNPGGPGNNPGGPGNNPGGPGGDMPDKPGQ